MPVHKTTSVLLLVVLFSSGLYNFSGVIVDMLASNAVDRGFGHRSGQTKNYKYKIGICCFSTKHAALRRKNKDWLAQNQDSVRVFQ